MGTTSRSQEARRVHARDRVVGVWLSCSLCGWNGGLRITISAISSPQRQLSHHTQVGGTASGDYWGKYDRKISIRTGDGSDYFVARRLVHFFLSKDRPFIYTATNVALLSCRAFVLMSPRSARCGDVPRFLGEGRARDVRDMRNSTGQVPLG